MTFPERIWGRIPWKNFINVHSDTWIFELTGTNFWLILVRQSLRWNFNKMLLQASTNTFKKWFAKVVIILKNSFIWTGISLSQGAKRLEEGMHIHVQICLLLKNEKQFQPVSHSVWLLFLFSTHNIWDSENSGWKRYSHVILGNHSISMFCFMVIIEENPASHVDQYFEKVHGHKTKHRFRLIPKDDIEEKPASHVDKHFEKV